MKLIIDFLSSTLVSSSITLCSLLFGLVQYRQKKKAERALKSITWDDMQKASEKIAKKLIKKYQPAVIYIPNIKSGIMLQFIRNYFKEYIPIIVGQTISKEYFKEDACNKIEDLDNYWYVDTQKWYAYIPNILLKYKDQKVLIIDNVSLTGNFLNTIIKELDQHGISSENIITACIATTEAAIADRMAPQYYYKILMDSKTVYMPWGV